MHEPESVNVFLGGVGASLAAIGLLASTPILVYIGVWFLAESVVLFIVLEMFKRGH